LVVILFFTLNFGFSQAYSGKAKIRGFVYDENGKPLEGVKVKLFSIKANDGFEKKTDKKGEWKAFWVIGGQWHADFFKPGYEPKKISFSVREDGKILKIEIKLKKMEGVVLTSDLLKELDEGNKLFEEGRYDEAIKKYNEILKKNPEAYVIYYSIGNCYFQKKEYEKAIEFYKKVLEKNPEYDKALIGMGNCYINSGKKEEALTWYNKVDPQKIDNAVILYNIGVIYYNNMENEKAIKYFEQAIKVNPNFADSYYQLGLLYIGLNKMKKGIELLKKYIEIAPETNNAKTAKQIIKTLEKSS